ncbi:MAG: PLP-dependent aminotransferase family protein [Silicimonas sp.]|nr:PLP-dependent aminotransferase family protein [Silicimonas sp.]
MGISEDMFFLDAGFEGTLQQQIQSLVAEGILSGRFRPGEKLPSSRRLARHLSISRITVTLAYTELQADDYITARGRSGYYVSATAPQPRLDRARAPVADRVDWAARIGTRFTAAPQLAKPEDWQRYRYPFIYGQSDPSLFDHANWRLCALQALGLRNFDAMTSDYFDRDDPKLIEFIARHSLPRRGILAGPDEILVTLGAQNAIWLAAEVLLGGGGQAVIERPCYPGLSGILALTRGEVEAVDVDAGGLAIEAIPATADVVFVTPSHHCPTTVTMPLARRRALLARAARDDLIVVEDDYEFEMSFLTPPSPALKSLDTEGRVIHVGSFSKSLFPGLRLGYIVGSRDFIREARALRAAVLRHPPGHIQRTAATFMALGHYDALIKRTAATYKRRRRIMAAAFNEHGLQIAGGGEGGSSFWMRAPRGVDTGELARRLAADSVLIEPGAPFFAGEAAPPSEFFRLAYSSIPDDRIAEGVARIARAIAGF